MITILFVWYCFLLLTSNMNSVYFFFYINHPSYLNLIGDSNEQTKIDIYVLCKMSFCLNSKSEVYLFCPVLAYLTSAVSNEITIMIW